MLGIAIANALIMGSDAHDAAGDRYGPDRYAVHLLSVLSVLFEFHVVDDDILVAAPLHDAIEDTDVTIKHTHTVDAAGTEINLINDSWNVQAGWLYLPTPEERLWFTSAAGMVLSNEEVVAATTVTITVVFEEFKMV